MDVLLLGAAAVVLIALTLWIVWRAPAEAVRSEDTAEMIPQGDRFEDQYTSATADLSAGGVALATSGAEDSQEDAARTLEPAAQPRVQTSSSADAWPEASLGPQGSHAGLEGTRPRTAPAPVRAQVLHPSQRTDDSPSTSVPTTKIGIGAAAALAVGSAAAGAWLYARWQRERSKPLSRLRRRFR